MQEHRRVGHDTLARMIRDERLAGPRNLVREGDVGHLFGGQLRSPEATMVW